MPTPERSKSRYYRPELDVVRFLAFLLVFLHHTLPSTKDPRVAHLLRNFIPVWDALGDACAFGLSLFFALSAFLICELLLRERESVGAVGIKQFYIRRILRIWPLYYLGLALGVGAAFLPGGDPGSVIKLGWFTIFMGSVLITTHGVFNNPASVLWSISVEEQFYLFAPWAVKLLSRKSLYGFCFAIILVANAWLFYLGTVRAPDYRVWHSSIVEWECFAGGILLCLALRERLPRLQIWLRIGLIVLGLSCWFFACYGFHARFGSAGEHNPGIWPLIGGYALGSLGSVLMLVAFLGIRSDLLPNWAIYLGRISFGLYVYHLFAIDLTDRLILRRLAPFKDGIINSLKGPIYLLTLGLTLGLTILMAWVSYRYFETPFLKTKKRHAVIESEPIGTVRIPENV